MKHPVNCQCSGCAVGYLAERERVRAKASERQVEGAFRPLPPVQGKKAEPNCSHAFEWFTWEQNGYAVRDVRCGSCRYLPSAAMRT